MGIDITFMRPQQKVSFRNTWDFHHVLIPWYFTFLGPPDFCQTCRVCSWLTYCRWLFVAVVWWIHVARCVLLVVLAVFWFWCCRTVDNVIKKWPTVSYIYIYIYIYIYGHLAYINFQICNDFMMSYLAWIKLKSCVMQRQYVSLS